MQIDPNAMNQHLRQPEKEDRYQRKTAIEPIVEYKPGEADDYDRFEDMEEEYIPEPPKQRAKQQPEREYRQYNNPQHEEDEEVLPGVFQSDILSWKKQFGDIYTANVKDQLFIFRALERFEYKQIISVPNTDPLMREEMICENCILYPQGYDFSTMANQKAGYPAVLSELIMDHSGFTRDVQVRKL